MIANTFWVALLIAIVLTAAFVWGFKIRGAWGNGLAFFAVVFLASWAAGTWVRPLGEAVPQAIPWFTQLVIGLIVALLMSSSVPSWSRKPRAAGTAAATGVQVERRSPPVSLLTPAYWVALVVLFIAIIVR